MHPPHLAHRFDRLGEEFFSRVQPTPLPSPYVVAWNSDLAAELGLEGEAGEWLAPLVGNQTLPEYPPLAALYSGHQFGVYVQQLGDGRAITIAELDTPAGIQEIQLKGAGPTPYSRFGDGRAVLRSSIREYLCSEAMHGLGIPTTRALAITGSDAPVRRETFETAAVVTRVAPSFIRFGSFEVFFYRDRTDELRRLADYVIEHFYPDCRHADNPYQAFLEEVIDRTAALMARWQAVGFCHGVMNTDNMSILGLTLDYGPFGFLDGYDPHHICNHSDTQGRYAYDQQPHIALWNLYCLAQALIPLLDKDQATAALEAYGGRFEAYMGDQFRQKLGLLTWRESDWELAGRLSQLMEPARTDWTIFWRTLGRFDSGEAAHNAELRDLIADREGFGRWARDYALRLREENNGDAERRRRMDRVNPKYVLRNHLAETAIRKARDERDYAEIERLRRCLSKPFDEQPEFEDYAAPPPDWASALSVSCSS